MSKAPAFQFYVRDWLSDPQLRQASPAAKGIWIDCLCFMWEAPNKGQLTGTIAGLSRMLGVSEHEFGAFLSEVETLGFASLERQQMTPADQKVTLENRRMAREAQSKKSHTNRQRRYVERKKNGHGDGVNDAEVTPPSSSSSSSSSSSEVLSNQQPPPDNTGEPSVVVADEIKKHRERYKDQKIIDLVLQSLKSTRQTFSMSDNLVLAEFRWWGNYPEDHVRASMQVYLDGDHAAQGRAEKYLRGIIRNHAQDAKGQKRLKLSNPPDDDFIPAEFNYL